MVRSMFAMAATLAVLGTPFVPACGGTTTAAHADGGGPFSDGRAPSDEAFCTGSSPRVMINGVEVQVLNVSGKAVALDCCDSSELRVATAAYQAEIDLLWRAQAGSSKNPIDLGAAPSGLQVELDLGCDPATTDCASTSPQERFATGFHGTIDYGPASTELDPTYCVTVAETAAAPHTAIHSLVLYAPKVKSPY